MRRPLGEVLAWPAAHVDLLLAFTAREPTPDERIELGLAQLSALNFNTNRGSAAAKSTADFLIAQDWWGEALPAALSDLDHDVRRALGRAAKDA